MSKINELIKEICPNGVEYIELYKVTKWNKRFSGVNKEWQPEIVSTKSNVSAQELKSLALDSGNIKLLSQVILMVILIIVFMLEMLMI